NDRSAEQGASGRSHGLTSTPIMIRPPAARGTGRPASDRRNRATSTRPLATASYNAPCPRRCSAASDNSTSDLTGPSAHSTASPSSNNASARRDRHRYSSSRKPVSTSSSPPVTASVTLLITALGCDPVFLVENMINQGPHP